MRDLAVAAFGCHAEWFADRNPAEAFAVGVISFKRKDVIQRPFTRSMTRRDVGPPTHFVPATGSFTEAIRLGLGWGLVPEGVALPALADGRLVDLPPGRHLDVALNWQCWRLESMVLSGLTSGCPAA
jgi:LysR family transcriptional regulator (chromosome initiation inhibitor)